MGLSPQCHPLSQILCTRIYRTESFIAQAMMYDISSFQVIGCFVSSSLMRNVDNIDDVIDVMLSVHARQCVLVRRCIRSFRLSWLSPVWGRGTPLFPLVHLLPHLFPFLLFPFFAWLYLFSSFVHPFLSTRIVPLRFQAGGRRRRLNLGLVCFFV